MTIYYRGVSGSQYVYWNNVSSFMPVGTTNTMIIDQDIEDSIPGGGSTGIVGSQYTLAQLVSMSFTYSVPGKPLLSAYVFSNSERSGIDKTGNGRNLVGGANVSSSAAILSYSDILATGSNMFTAINIGSGSASVWNTGNMSSSFFLNSTESFCLEIAYKPYTVPIAGNWQSIFGNYAGSVNDLCTTWIRSTDQRLQYSLEVHDPNVYSVTYTLDVTSSLRLISNQWYHLVFHSIRNTIGVNGFTTSSIYINGIIDGRNITSFPPSYRLTNSKPQFIGSNNTGDTPQGYVAYAKYHNANLTDADVLLLYSNSFIGLLKSGGLL